MSWMFAPREEALSLAFQYFSRLDVARELESFLQNAGYLQQPIG